MGVMRYKDGSVWKPVAVPYNADDDFEKMLAELTRRVEIIESEVTNIALYTAGDENA